MKVDYVTVFGTRSTAYLDGEPDGGSATGTDKYTDRPLTLVWDGIKWRERSDCLCFRAADANGDIVINEPCFQHAREADHG